MIAFEPTRLLPACAEETDSVRLRGVQGSVAEVIWLLRHGDAEDAAPGGGGDEARRLTGAGVDQARDAGRALATLGVTLDACLASPKLRALDSAHLVCESLAIKPQADDRLAGGDFDPAELAAGRGEVLLVGHEPDFSRAIEAMTGTRVKLKKGGLAAVDGDQLVLLVRPADLREMRG